MSDSLSFLSLYNDFLKTFAYSPITNWQRAFSPTFTFIGKNVGDADTEQHVLNEVGSYGMQLNRVLNVFSVLVHNMDKTNLEEQKIKHINEFKELASAADKASTEFKELSLNKMIDDLHSLQREDPKNYKKFVDRIRKEFP